MTGSKRESSTSLAYLLVMDFGTWELTIDHRALESSMDEQRRWNKEVTQAVDRLYVLQKAAGTTAGKETAR
jgi:hypothetical protein